MVCTEVGRRGSYVQSWKCERESTWKCVRVQHEAKSERVHEMAQHPPGVGEGVKLSTRQSFSGWLNAEALMNIPPIFVTLSTRQSFSGWLNDEA